MKRFAILKNTLIHSLTLTALVIGVGAAGVLRAEGGLVTPAGQRAAPPGAGGMQGQDNIPGHGASRVFPARKP
ncbi:hypothetical protein SAMN05216420_10457 [Nitrosospira sp. Nl5]|uniref:hypothetical protein n=1 Tax=Nitrosospira sp. Nl5 TaxID=200120 RepID=UPI00088FE756|nr:hypothetical protein [Nitrosospira sp. Nl5]SCY26973.1 hypothetical protein SAMN05216420_10457 [Nitrosospira sp. Nl5]